MGVDDNSLHTDPVLKSDDLIAGLVCTVLHLSHEDKDKGKDSKSEQITALQTLPPLLLLFYP